MTFAALRAQVCPNPCRHGSGVGLGLVGNDDPPLQRNLPGQRHLRRACRFGTKFTPGLAIGFLASVLVRNDLPGVPGFRVAGWRLDALLPGDAIGKAFHRRRWWTNSRLTTDHAAEQRPSSGASAFRELADDALSDIAHGVDRANHLLLADHDLVERTFKLCRYAWVDKRRIGLFENPEQRQTSLGGEDVLSLGDQKTLLL